MKFTMNGIPKGGNDETEEFRKLWGRLTTEENAILNGGNPRNLSPAQKLVIDLYCGHDEPYTDNKSEREIIGFYSAHQEFLAIERARSRALATWFDRGMIRR